MTSRRMLSFALALTTSIATGCAEDETDSADAPQAPLAVYAGALRATASLGSPGHDERDGAVLNIDVDSHFDDGRSAFTLSVIAPAQQHTFRNISVRYVCDMGRYKVTPTQTYTDSTLAQRHLTFFYFGCGGSGKLISATASATY